MRYPFQLLGILILVGAWLALLAMPLRSLARHEATARNEMTVLIFLQANIPDSEAQKWGDSLRTRDPEIESAEFVSKVQALQGAQKDPALSKALLLLRENPFPATYILHYTAHAWLDRPEPAMALRDSPEIQEIRWNPEARTIFQILHREHLHLRRVMFVGFGIWIAILALALCEYFRTRKAAGHA